LLQATLTLPGIAGIVLTIGMAVDANVLIYERIREEVRQGKSPISAIEAGYKRALGTILDANITTFIAAVILFQMGSGPVRGFAVTLAIGIVTSVFTAFTVTRLMVSVWIRRRRPGAVPL
jgi:protein-export membrane protein SecD